MNQALVFRSADPDFYPRADVRLKLLIEMEPRYRVFFRNLFDLLMPRNEPPLFLASRPIVLARPLCIRTGVRPRAVLESLAWHLAVAPLLLILWTWSSTWEHRPYPARQARNIIHTQFDYHKPVESFPARAGRQEQNLASVSPHHSIVHLKIVRLKTERKQAVVSPPPMRVNEGTRNRITALKRDLPAMPLLATARPDVNQSSARKFALPLQAVIAPPPQTGDVHVARGIGVPVAFPNVSAPNHTSATVIAPAHHLQGLIGKRGSEDIDIGPSVVVPPPPQLPMHEQHAGWGSENGSLGGSGSGAVPPPPSVNGAVTSGKGVGTSMVGLAIVPPPPAVGGSTNRFEAGGSTLAGSGVQVVPPPPVVGQSSVLAAGGGSALAGTGVQAVPPPAVISHSEGLGSSRGGVALASMEVQALPVEGLGPQDGLARSGANGSPGADSEGSLGAAKSVETGAANGDSLPTAGLSTVMATATATNPNSDPATEKTTPQGKQPMPMVRTAIPPVADVPGGTTRTLPLRVIQLALALPRTSYFTNYEAYLAERSLNDHETQLVKLVYIFLPYQRGLTEYGLSTSKKFRLRVTRDPSCDESLLNMTWREAEQTFGPSQAVHAESDKNKLPCYRTTADDYRKALERAR